MSLACSGLPEPTIRGGSGYLKIVLSLDEAVVKSGSEHFELVWPLHGRPDIVVGDRSPVVVDMRRLRARHQRTVAEFVTTVCRSVGYVSPSCVWREAPGDCRIAPRALAVLQ